jgi:hypothetical protein
MGKRGKTLRFDIRGSPRDNIGGENFMDDENEISEALYDALYHIEERQTEEIYAAYQTDIEECKKAMRALQQKLVAPPTPREMPGGLPKKRRGQSNRQN